MTPRNRLFAVVFAMGAAGCAQSAPPLPPDLGALPPAQRLLPGDDRDSAFSLPCADLRLAVAENGAWITEDLNVIQSRRGQNQTAAYVGLVLFPPLLAGVADNSAEQAEIETLKQRRDILLRIAQAHGCPIRDAAPVPTIAADDPRWDVIMAAAVGAAAVGATASPPPGAGGATNPGVHRVRGYVTKSGSQVAPHLQTNPNDTKADNFSSRGNVNPYTGSPGKTPITP